jgi:predicted DNA-binding transcriptional regulator YafY
MKDVKPTDEPREGEDKFKRMGISDYAKQTFGMFIGGNADRITIQFENSLLDAMLERFPKGPDTVYTKVDDKHFTVKTFIVESENFYGWICGLGGKAIIIEPQETAKRFKEYLEKIEAGY